MLFLSFSLDIVLYNVEPTEITPFLTMQHRFDIPINGFRLRGVKGESFTTVPPDETVRRPPQPPPVTSSHAVSGAPPDETALDKDIHHPLTRSRSSLRPEAVNGDDPSEEPLSQPNNPLAPEPRSHKKKTVSFANDKTTPDIVPSTAPPLPSDRTVEKDQEQKGEDQEEVCLEENNIVQSSPENGQPILPVKETEQT